MKKQKKGIKIRDQKPLSDPKGGRRHHVRRIRSPDRGEPAERRASPGRIEPWQIRAAVGLILTAVLSTSYIISYRDRRWG